MSRKISSNTMPRKYPCRYLTNFVISAIIIPQSVPYAVGGKYAPGIGRWCYMAWNDFFQFIIAVCNILLVIKNYNKKK